MKYKYLSVIIFCFAFGQIQSQITKVLPELSLSNKLVLDNGITLVHIQNPLNSDIYCYFNFDIPNTFDNYQYFLDKLTFENLQAGTDNIKKEDFKKRLIKSGIYTEIKDNSLEVITSTNSFDSLAYLVSKIVTKPMFYLSDWEKSKDKILTAYKESDHEIEEKELISLFFEQSINSSSKSPDQIIESIDSAQISNNYYNYFLKADKYLIVVADLPFDTVVFYAKKHFLQIPKSKKNELYKFKNKQISENAVKCYYQPENKNDSIVKISSISTNEINISEKNYHLLKLIDKIIFYNNTSRLFNISVVKNKAESCTGLFHYSTKQCFLFSTVESMKNRVKPVSKSMEFVINRLTDTLISEGELDYISNIEIDIFLKSLERFDVIAEMLIDVQKYKLSPDYFEHYTNTIKMTTEDEVFEECKNIFSKNKYDVLISGQESNILYNELIKLAKDFEIKIYENNEEIETIQSGFDAQDITDKYKNLVGTEKKYKGQILELRGVYKFGEDTSVVVQTIKRLGVKYISESYIYKSKKEKDLIKREIYTGKTGYRITKDYTLELEGKELEELKRLSLQHEETDFGKDSIVTELLGRFNCDTTICYKINSKYPSGFSCNNYYDVNSGLKIKTEELTKDKVSREIFISDYREIPGSSGKMIAYKKTIKTDKYTAVFTLEKINNNANINPADFEPKN